MGKEVGLTLRAKVRREARGEAPKAAACRAARLEGRAYVQRRSLLQPPLQAQEATAFDEAEIKTPEIITAPEGTYWKHSQQIKAIKKGSGVRGTNTCTLSFTAAAAPASTRSNGV